LKKNESWNKNIIEPYGYCYFENNFFVLMEYFKSETLQDAIDNNFKNINEDEKKNIKEFKLKILNQIINAMIHIHEAEIELLDLNPRNILVIYFKK
jgi:serine/threonine protein kinase